MITNILLTTTILTDHNNPTPKQTIPTTSPKNYVQQIFKTTKHNNITTYLNYFNNKKQTHLKHKLTNQSPNTFTTALIKTVTKLKKKTISIKKNNKTQYILTIKQIYLNQTNQQTHKLAQNNNN